MKRISIIIAILSFPAFLLAQETPLSSFYSEYVSEPGFETTEILPGSTGFEWEKNVDSEHIKDMVKDIESVRILEYKGEGKYSTDKLWKKMASAIDEDIYTEVVNINSDDTQAAVYILKGPSGTYREVALLAREQSEITLVTVTGIIDFKEIFSPETMESLRGLSRYYRNGKDGCEVK
jgi:hypothetical protein